MEWSNDLETNDGDSDGGLMGNGGGMSREMVLERWTGLTGNGGTLLIYY